MNQDQKPAQVTPVLPGRYLTSDQNQPYSRNMTNTHTINNLGGTWYADYFFAVAKDLPVVDGTTNYMELAEALMLAVVQWQGAWVEGGKFLFVNDGKVVVWFDIDAATRKVDANWLRNGEWVGMDVDMSGRVAAAQAMTARSGAL